MTRRDLLGMAAVAVVTPDVVRLRLRHTWTTVMSSSEYRDNLHLRYTRDGVTGLGEGAPIPRYQEDAASARKTGRVVVVHEAPRSFGPGAEVVARLVEKAFLYLEAPIRRVTGFDIVIPLFQREQEYLPGVYRIVQAVRETLNF